MEKKTGDNGGWLPPSGSCDMAHVMGPGAVIVGLARSWYVWYTYTYSDLPFRLNLPRYESNLPTYRLCSMKGFKSRLNTFSFAANRSAAAKLSTDWALVKRPLLKTRNGSSNETGVLI